MVWVLWLDAKVVVPLSGGYQTKRQYCSDTLKTEHDCLPRVTITYSGMFDTQNLGKLLSHYWILGLAIFFNFLQNQLAKSSFFFFPNFYHQREEGVWRNFLLFPRVHILDWNGQQGGPNPKSLKHLFNSPFEIQTNWQLISTQPKTNRQENCSTLPNDLLLLLQTRGMGLYAANSDQQYPFFFSPSHTKVNMCYWSTKHKFQIDVPFFLENIHCQSVLANPDIVWDMAQHQLTFIVQASPLTKSVLGRQKSVTVRGELLTVSLYPDIFIVWRSNWGLRKVSL